MDRAREDMLEACRCGYVDTAKRLITDRSVDVNVNLHPDTDGSTPLYVACFHGCTEVVRNLLSIPDCQVNCVNERWGETPLHVMCSRGHRYDHINVGLLLATEHCNPNVKDPNVQTLLETGKCDPNVQTKNTGDTPLHLATGIEDTRIIQLLLADPQCDPNVSNNQDETPLHVALKLHNIDIFIRILERGCHETYSNRDQMLTEASSLFQQATGGSLLHLACEVGSTTVVELFLAEPQCDPNVTNYRGETPLHVACWNGKAIAVKALLETGKCDPNVQTKTGDTPLHLATQIEDTRIIQILLADPQCDPNVTNKQGQTPLHVACWKGKAMIVKTLLETGKYDPNVQTNTGDTPLHLARDTETIELLLADPQCDPNVTNNQGETPLHVACEKREAMIIKTLFETGKCDPNVQTNTSDTPLHLATQIEDTEIIQLLLADPQCDPNVANNQGETPLHFACWKGKAIAVKTLLETGKYDPNVQTNAGDTPLHLASDTETIQLLLADPQCDPNVTNKQGETPLHFACWKGKAIAVKTLFETGKYDPNVQTNAGDTPLHLTRDTEIIELLLADPQCDPNVTNKQGQTPLHVACEKREAMIVKTLLETGKCDPNVQTNTGDTPLHVATQVENANIVQLLLADPQCDPNVTNKKGQTPLHVACRKGKAMIVKTLFETGKCDPNVQTNTGDTPLHVATQIEDTEIIQLLLADPQCDPNVANNRSETPLHVALRLENFLALIRLLEKGCNGAYVHKELMLKEATSLAHRARGDSLLHMACAWGSYIVIKSIICSKTVRSTHEHCFLNTHGDAAVHIAVKQNLPDILKLLISDKDCNPNMKNSEGDTPLHTACRLRNLECVKLLLHHDQCNPNTLDSELITALHIAVTSDENGCIVKALLTNPQCDLNIANKKGETSLHTACKNRCTECVKSLLATGKCVITVQTDVGESPLHAAVEANQLTIVELLLAHECCNPIATNYLNETPLSTACKHWHADCIKVLLKDHRCKPPELELNAILFSAIERNDLAIVQLVLPNVNYDPNMKSNDGGTALISACKLKRINCVEILLANKRCNPSLQDDNGNSALHIAVQANSSEVVWLLLSHKSCNPNLENRDGETPLQLACKHISLECVEILLTHESCDSQSLNRKITRGNTLLHLAAESNDSELVSILLCNKHIDPNVVDDEGKTPLHIACRQGHYEGVKVLVNDKKCEPNLPDKAGNTPLHQACIQGALQIVQLLLSSGKVDPECVNKAGKIPVELAGTDYQIIQVLNSFTENKRKHPIETFVKIFIIGNAETGKSTLIQAICTEASQILKLWGLPASYKQVKPEDVEPHTAGIIPRRFRSKHFGNTVLYDFAGQYEYYSSHAAVMENVAVPTPPAFVVVVDISEPIDKITEKLTYWWSFIENHCKRTSVPPPVILAGSHKDIIKARKENVEERMKQILGTLKEVPTTFHFVGHVAIDCRLLASKGLDKLLLLLNETCQSLRKTSDVDLRCHVLYAFLTDKFHTSIACKVSDLITTIQGEDTLLPQNPAELEHLLYTLSDKGQVLVLKNTSNPEDSWIVMQREQLLSEVNGSIFAPDNFDKCVKNFAKSTGVVPHSKIQQQFPQYPLDIVVGFLSHLEFCFKIDDYPTLEMIAGEREPQSPTSPTDRDEEFYFFPALVRVKYPTDVWKKDQASMKFQCGWFYQCIIPNQFLSPRFLHVLILRLAFKFALAVDHDHRHLDQSVVIRRRCSAWKHGIAWWDRDGIETVVEVGLQCRWVTVMMCCLQGQEIECAYLRTSVINTILDTRTEFCPAVAMSQSLIDPQCLQYPLEDGTQKGINITQYSLEEIAKAVTQGKPCVIDRSGTSSATLQELLPFEPYLGLGNEVIAKLFECTSEQIAQGLTKKVARRLEPIKTAMNSFRYQKFNIDDQSKNLTIRDFVHQLSHFSIFCGQNPLELAGLVVAPTQLQADQSPDAEEGDRPTMVELIRFRARGRRINIPQEISTQYKRFGILLLEDSTGARIKNIAAMYRGNPEDINMEALQQWIVGKGKMPVTWQTLVDVLWYADLNKLAIEVASAKLY